MQTFALITLAATLAQSDKQQLPSVRHTETPHYYDQARPHKPANHVNRSQPYAAPSHMPHEEVDQEAGWVTEMKATQVDRSTRSIARAGQREAKRNARLERMAVPKWVREVEREKGRRVKQTLQRTWEDGDEQLLELLPIPKPRTAASDERAFEEWLSRYHAQCELEAAAESRIGLNNLCFESTTK